MTPYILMRKHRILTVLDKRTKGVKAKKKPTQGRLFGFSYLPKASSLGSGYNDNVNH